MGTGKWKFSITSNGTANLETDLERQKLMFAIITTNPKGHGRISSCVKKTMDIKALVCTKSSDQYRTYNEKKFSRHGEILPLLTPVGTSHGLEQEDFVVRPNAWPLSVSQPCTHELLPLLFLRFFDFVKTIRCMKP